jgi:hypothetical protein
VARMHWRLPGLSSSDPYCLYSPKYLEEEFCELRTGLPGVASCSEVERTNLPVVGGRKEERHQCPCIWITTRTWKG